MRLGLNGADPTAPATRTACEMHVLMMQTKHSGSLNEVTRHKSSGFCEGNKDLFRGAPELCSCYRRRRLPLCYAANQFGNACCDWCWMECYKKRALSGPSLKAERWGVLMRSTWQSSRQARAHLALPFRPLNPAAVLQIASVRGFSNETHQSKVRKKKQNKTLNAATWIIHRCNKLAQL